MTETEIFQIWQFYWQLASYSCDLATAEALKDS